MAKPTGRADRVTTSRRGFNARSRRTLGRLGEEQVFHHERAHPIAADRPDLARRIEWTSPERGDGSGYEIKSFDPTGADRLI